MQAEFRNERKRSVRRLLKMTSRELVTEINQGNYDSVILLAGLGPISERVNGFSS